VLVKVPPHQIDIHLRTCFQSLIPPLLLSPFQFFCTRTFFSPPKYFSLSEPQTFFTPFNREIKFAPLLFAQGPSQLLSLSHPPPFFFPLSSVSDSDCYLILKIFLLVSVETVTEGEDPDRLSEDLLSGERRVRNVRPPLSCRAALSPRPPPPLPTIPLPLCARKVTCFFDSMMQPTSAWANAPPVLFKAPLGPFTFF